MISVSPERLFVTVIVIVSRIVPFRFSSVSVTTGAKESPCRTVAGKTPLALVESFKTLIADDVTESVAKVASM